MIQSVYQTARFFGKSARFIQKAKKDENYCAILLTSISTLAEKIGNQDMPEAKYFEDNLFVFENGLKTIADPYEYHRTFLEIRKILDQIIDSENYPEQEPRPCELAEYLPIIISKLNS